MNIFKGSLVIISVTSFVVLLTACSSEAPRSGQSPWPDSAPSTIPESELKHPAIITDRTGRDWDVTHARNVYGMHPDNFNYGLGIGVISSVDSPTVLEKGAPGFPAPDNHMVFGVNHNGEQRAYSVGTLTRHEVFNDVYQEESNQYIAVTY